MFFLFEQIKSYGYTDIVANSYQYFVFLKYSEVFDIFRSMEKLMVLHVRDFWIPYFIFANSVYLLICWIIIELIAVKFSQPIITLAERVKSNVKNIHKLRNYKQNGESGGAKFSIADLQIDLLKGYVQQNQETNDLYFSFNSMARVIFLGYQSTQEDFSYQAL